MKNNILIDPKRILLGKGIFRIDGEAIGATQGGGKFTLEREYRDTAVDGAPGKIVGMTHKEGSTPTLELNHLEIISDDILKRHPALKKVEGTDGKSTKITGAGDIRMDDYHTVEFVGYTKDGREVIITVENAINLENIEFEVKEKSEVIDKCTFTGTYPEDFSIDYEPWSIEYIKEVKNS